MKTKIGFTVVLSLIMLAIIITFTRDNITDVRVVRTAKIGAVVDNFVYPASIHISGNDFAYWVTEQQIASITLGSPYLIEVNLWSNSYRVINSIYPLNK